MNVALQWATPDIDKQVTGISDQAIVMAYAAGYTATEYGDIISPRGKVLTGGTTKQSYRTFTPAVYPNGKRCCVLQHRFVAYCKFGAEIFNHACVRHLNDVPTDNRWENLELGSYQQNTQDMPPSKRKARSVGAGDRIVEQNRKLTDKAIKEIRRLRAETSMPYKALAKAFGVTTMTAYRAVTHKSWSNV